MDDKNPNLGKALAGLIGKTGSPSLGNFKFEYDSKLIHWFFPKNHHNFYVSVEKPALFFFKCTLP